MNAELYDPAQHPVADALVMTPAALAHIRRQLAREGATALLLGIRESGCNGYMYDLSYVGENKADIRAFDFDGVRVFIENADWALVRGTEIDYVTQGLNSVLVFKNPNATAECGCGESFSAGDGSAAQAQQ